MKLCADILYWRLKEKLTTVTQRGKGGIYILHGVAL